MGRLTLIILVLFSATAIYSEANAAADSNTPLYELTPGTAANVCGDRPHH